MATTLSYFNDKLSPETRVLIYGFVFGASKHVKRVYTDRPSATEPSREDDRKFKHGLPTPNQAHRRVTETAILAVNKHISAEALETLYNAKTVRLTFEQLNRERRLDYLNFVRRLELVDCIRLYYMGLQDARPLARSVLRLAQALPRIISTTVLSDCLAYVPGLRKSIPMVMFAESVGLGDVMCTDIGRYALQGEFRGIEFANSKLLKMWPSVVGLPEGYDARGEAREILGGWKIYLGHKINLMAWASHTSLRLWVALYEEGLASIGVGKMAPDLYSGDDKDGILDLSRRADVVAWTRSVKTNHLTTFVPQGADGERVPMHKLGPQHDATTLQWATELLAMNIETYGLMQDSDDDEDEGVYDAKVCWSALEDGESVGVEQAREAAAELEHWLLITDPVKGTHIFRVGSVRSLFQASQPLKDLLRFDDDDVNALGVSDLTKVFHLMIAIGHWHLYDEQDEDFQKKKELLDVWSAGLLRKYLSRIKGFSEHDIKSASLGKLQERFQLVFGADQLIRWVTQEDEDEEDGGALARLTAQSISNATKNWVGNDEEEEELYKPFLRRAAVPLRYVWATETAREKETRVLDDGDDDEGHIQRQQQKQNEDGEVEEEEGKDGICAMALSRGGNDRWVWKES